MDKEWMWIDETNDYYVPASKIEKTSTAQENDNEMEVLQF